MKAEGVFLGGQSDGKIVGKVKQVQSEGKIIQEAKEGERAAVSMEEVTFGRQVKEGDVLISVEVALVVLI